MNSARAVSGRSLEWHERSQIWRKPKSSTTTTSPKRSCFARDDQWSWHERTAARRGLCHRTGAPPGCRPRHVAQSPGRRSTSGGLGEACRGYVRGSRCSSEAVAASLRPRDKRLASGRRALSGSTEELARTARDPLLSRRSTGAHRQADCRTDRHPRADSIRHRSSGPTRRRSLGVWRQRRLWPCFGHRRGRPRRGLCDRRAADRCRRRWSPHRVSATPQPSLGSSHGGGRDRL